MTLSNRILQQLEAFNPSTGFEESNKASFLLFLNTFDESLWATRNNVVGHLTASAWVVNHDRTKVLMAYHNTYDSWAWLGGHADNDLDLARVALKEASEETGLSPEALRLASEMPALFTVVHVGHHVKRGIYVPDHLHYDVAYVIEADDTLPLKPATDENSAVQWFANDVSTLEHVQEAYMHATYTSLINRSKTV